VIIINDYHVPSYKTWHLVINGMRNSWESWEKGDSKYTFDPYGNETDEFVMGEKDKKLALNLATLAPSHGKFLRQLQVIVDFSAPEYFLKEFDTYKIGTTSNRTSMMHTLGKQAFSADMFSFEDISEDHVRKIINELNTLRDDWIWSGKKKPSKEWRALLQAVPQSFMYHTTWSSNYQVLRDMYYWRRNHRQSEWHAWCDWIETLPYAELITAKENK